MRSFHPYEISITENSTPYSSLLADLVLHARQYTGCSWAIERGDRSGQGWAGSEYLGLQGDAFVWRFWSEGDAEDYRDDAMRIAASHGADCEMSIHPYRNGANDVHVRFLGAEAE